jgi:hypothetical protein
MMTMTKELKMDSKGSLNILRNYVDGSIPTRGAESPPLVLLSSLEAEST